ncbi:MAG: hypothetical protein ACI8PZ_005767 [Myxococcota bacterium]
MAPGTASSERPGVVLTWSASPEDASARVQYMRRRGVARALTVGALGVLLPAAALLSVTGSSVDGQLLWVLVPGLVLLPGLLLWFGWWLPRREGAGVQYSLELNASGLTQVTDATRLRVPWGAFERLVIGAGHLHLHVAGAVWHVPRHAVDDEGALLAHIDLWRRRPRRADAPSAPNDAVWEVRSTVAPADWARHARGRTGWVSGWATRLAVWRDPDLWPCGAREVRLGPDSGWVDDAGGVRRFSWADVVAADSAGGSLCLRFRNAPPVLLRERDLPSPAVVEDVRRWIAPVPHETPAASGPPEDPWAPPGGRVSRSARPTRSR